MALVNSKTEFSDTLDKAENHRIIARNLARHFYFIDKLAAEGAEFIGFPELSVNGYRMSANVTWLSLNGPQVKALQDKAKEKGVYISAGMAEIDDEGKKWNTQFLIGPDGKLIGRYHKIWLTKEIGFCESANEHPVFDVKGTELGIATCADGTNFNNLKALVDNGAKIIYGPHANTTGGTLAGWYKFRARWNGPAIEEYSDQPTSNGDTKASMPNGGWIDKLNVYAALHNHAALYNAEYNPPVAPEEDKAQTGWASGAMFIGPDGNTLAQMPTSTDKADSKEYVLIYNIPLK